MRREVATRGRTIGTFHRRDAAGVGDSCELLGQHSILRGNRLRFLSIARDQVPARLEAVPNCSHVPAGCSNHRVQFAVGVAGLAVDPPGTGQLDETCESRTSVSSRSLMAGLLARRRMSRNSIQATSPMVVDRCRRNESMCSIVSAAGVDGGSGRAARNRMKRRENCP